MYRIPFTQSVVVTGSERQDIATDFENAAQALEESAALNFTLLQDWMAAESKLRELSGIIVTQSDSAQQIMQINLLLSSALGRIRQGEDIDQVVTDLDSQLREFGGDGVEPLT